MSGYLRLLCSTVLAVIALSRSVHGNNDTYSDNVDTLKKCLCTCSEYPMMCQQSTCLKAFMLSAERLQEFLELTPKEVEFLWDLEKEAQAEQRLRKWWYWTPLVVRKECRELSSADRDDLFYAINYLKRNTSNPNVYFALAKLHKGFDVGVHAHGGSNFFGWHRIYLYYFERALRRVRRNVALCYWDSTIDFRLGRDEWIYTNAFSDILFGTADGVVDTGPFKNWTLPSPNEGLTLQRGMRAGRSQPMDPNAIDLLLNSPKLLNHSSITRGGVGHLTVTNSRRRRRTLTLEGEHDNVHVWVGSIMSFLDSAPLDPVFFFHHCYIDYVWERFRRKLKAHGIDPESDYPEHGYKTHERNYPMIGFNWYRNIDGYSDFFTDNIYSYDEPPSCSGHLVTCINSPFMECNSKMQCVAKKRPRPPRKIIPVTTFRDVVPRLTLTGRAFIANSHSD